MLEKGFWHDLLKYLLHGLGFSLILWAMEIPLSLLVMSFTTGIVIVVALIAVFFLMGLVNTFLAKKLWFPMKHASPIGLLAHGIILFTALLLVYVPLVFLPNQLAPGTTTWLATFFVSAPVNGYVCKTIASLWREAS